MWWRDGTSLPESDRANNSLKRERDVEAKLWQRGSEEERQMRKAPQ